MNREAPVSPWAWSIWRWPVVIAVLTAKDNGNYLVSVREPLSNKTGADELCMRFPTGGGRKAAAKCLVDDVGDCGVRCRRRGGWRRGSAAMLSS